MKTNDYIYIEDVRNIPGQATKRIRCIAKVTGGGGGTSFRYNPLASNDERVWKTGRDYYSPGSEHPYNRHRSIAKIKKEEVSDLARDIEMEMVAILL